MSDCQFYPGQKVLVVPEPVRCEYAWIGQMGKWCGQEVTVKRAIPDYDGGHWLIKVEENNYSWDETCFVDIPECVVSADEITNLL